MPNLWTRIARNQIFPFQRFYKCSSRSSSTALVRRSVTAPVQHRVGLDHVCAVLFSTIAFASAVADGNRKRTRQNEWVRVIKDAENDLRILKADQERRISNLARPPTQYHPDSYDAKSTVAESQTWEKVFRWAEGEIRERRALGFEGWQGMPLNVLRDASIGQVQDFQKRYRHLFWRFQSPPGPELWNTVTWPIHIKKTRTLEWSIALLTLQMMSHALEPQNFVNLHGRMDKVLAQTLTSESATRQSWIMGIKDRLARLSYNRENEEFYYQYPSPSYPRYTIDQVDDPNGADRLNAKLHALFATKRLNQRELIRLLPQICYHLLTSNAPPNIHTFNLLLSQFAGDKINPLVEYLLKSMEITHMRVNEITLVQILRYYLRTDQADQFDRYVSKMNGYRKGLGEVFRNIEIPDLLKHLYLICVPGLDDYGERDSKYYDYTDFDKAEMFALSQKRSLKIYEKPRRNLAVHRALIQGALSFHGMSAAMDHYRTMTNEGWEPDQEILLDILQQCLVDSDWDAGIATWARFQRLPDSNDERAYTLMLHLCQKLGKQDFIQDLLRHGNRRRILPPTTLEVSWEGTSEDDTLGEAKNVLRLKQGLQELVQKQREADGGLVVDPGVVKFIAGMIEEAVPFPRPDTIALLHEAGLIASGNHELLRIDKLLQNSQRRILSMIHELKDIQLSTSILAFETQLEKASSAMIQNVESMGALLLSMCLRSLGECVNIISTSIERLCAGFHNREIYTHLIRLNYRYDNLEKQTNTTRKEVSAFTDHLILRPSVLAQERSACPLHLGITTNSTKSRSFSLRLYRMRRIPSSIRKVNIPLQPIRKVIVEQEHHRTRRRAGVVRRENVPLQPIRRVIVKQEQSELARFKVRLIRDSDCRPFGSAKYLSL